jgi:hypothetical protein
MCVQIYNPSLFDFDLSADKIYVELVYLLVEPYLMLYSDPHGKELNHNLCS